MKTVLPTTPEGLEQMQERERFLLAVCEGLADAEAGRIIEDDEVERILDEELGPLKPG